MKFKKVRLVNLLCFSRGCSQKRGALGGGILVIGRLLTVVFIAFIIFGVASVFYSHYIDVRDAEAAIVGRSVLNCLAPNGIFDFDAYPEESVDKVFSYCGFGGEIDRIFVRVIFSKDGDELVRLYQGDSGALWIMEMYKDKSRLGNELGKYEPGYFKWDYSVFVLKDGNRVDASMNVEVLVKYE